LPQEHQPYAEEIFGSYQCGFRSGKHQIRYTWSDRLWKDGRVWGQYIFLFVGFKDAYDSIDRNELFKAMEEFSLPGKLRRLEE
jgi:hypothetical protein